MDRDVQEIRDMVEEDKQIMAVSIVRALIELAYGKKKNDERVIAMRKALEILIYDRELDEGEKIEF